MSNFTEKEIEALQNTPIYQLGNYIQTDLIDMGLVDENTSIYQYLKTYVLHEVRQQSNAKFL